MTPEDHPLSPTDAQHWRSMWETEKARADALQQQLTQGQREGKSGTTPEDIQARLAKITPGPWRALRRGDRCDGIAPAVHNHPFDDREERCYEYDCPADHEIVTTDSGCYGPKWDDADFIAHAPEDIHTLLALVDQLTRERDAAQEAMQALAVASSGYRERAEAAEARADSADFLRDKAESRCQEAIARADALQKELDEAHAAILEPGGWDERCRKAESRLALLEPALKMYGQHHDDCVKAPRILASTRPYVCTCGLDAALTGSH